MLRIKIANARMKNNKAPGDYELTVYMIEAVGPIGMQ
jgi:hypothetical protein